VSIRVLHVLDHSIPLHSGYTFRTLALLREQRRLGWQTFHLTSPKHSAPGGDEETVDDWHFFRTSPASGPRWPGLAELALMKRTHDRLLEVARRVKPDVIHAHSPVLNAVPALRAGRALGIPVVYEVRAFWEDAAVDHGTTHEGSVRYRLTRHMETRVLRQAGHVFTICEGLRKDIVARGIAPGKVTVVPNAVDIENFEPGGEPDAALKAQLRLAGSTVLGFIGSFYAYEGLDLLLAALPGMLRERADLRVLLVGGGPQEEALKVQAQALGIDDKVVFTGRVPHAHVQRYYDLVDLLVYPRHSMRLTELVTPLKPLEAMAQGRMLVASDVGGHRELLRDGETGHLFKAGDANALAALVSRLLRQPETWSGVRRAGRHFVESERSWRATAARYLRPYQALLPASLPTHQAAEGQLRAP
jgi:PEP-CTERM/exosortase A-associated glycosyltransferase